MSKRAKSLVKKWKQLLPEGEETQDCHQTSEGGGQGTEMRLEGVSLALRGLREDEFPAEQVRAPVPAFETESRASGSCMVDVTAHSHKRHHRDKEKKKKKKKKRDGSITAHPFEGSFSQALDVPMLPNSRHAHVGERHFAAEKRVGHSSVARCKMDDVVIVGASPGLVPGPVRTLAREKSPAAAGKVVPRVPAQREATAGVKRKGTVIFPPSSHDSQCAGFPLQSPHHRSQRLVSPRGQEHRSIPERNQQRDLKVGPSGVPFTAICISRFSPSVAVVTSLFDMCMKILIDNIDCKPLTACHCVLCG